MTRITSTNGNDSRAFGGKDLVGTDFDDDIFGLAGNDLLFGNGGNDTLNGGEGDDSFLIGITDGGDTIVEAANSGIDSVISSINFTRTYARDI